MIFIDTDNAENNLIRDSLFKQMKKYEDKEGKQVSRSNWQRV